MWTLISVYQYKLLILGGIINLCNQADSIRHVKSHNPI